ncbi:Hypothetical_protein [Hexamita inflata]|uniref:Hypothetical_protein n=1 Tax=Hexamita inflata TaxID=28002 RepID=A0ABP1HRK2_9EUKA
MSNLDIQRLFEKSGIQFIKMGRYWVLRSTYFKQNVEDIILQIREEAVQQQAENILRAKMIQEQMYQASIARCQKTFLQPQQKIFFEQRPNLFNNNQYQMSQPPILGNPPANQVQQHQQQIAFGQQTQQNMQVTPIYQVQQATYGQVNQEQVHHQQANQAQSRDAAYGAYSNIEVDFE